MKKLLFLWALILVVSQASAQFTGLPVTLSQPYDKEVLENNEPLLVWQTDLSTIIDNPRVSMRLTLVEILKDQTPAEAIQVNKPILIRDELKSNTWSYSSTDTELQPGHHYAWQVTLFYNSVMVQQSEVWEFSIKSPIPPLSAFHPVKTKQDGAIFSLLDGRLNIALVSNKEISTSAVIIDGKGVARSVQLQELIEGTFNDEATSVATASSRYFSIELSDLKKGIYTLKWPVGGDVYQITFRK